jgi:hypothetical protein
MNTFVQAPSRSKARIDISNEQEEPCQMLSSGELFPHCIVQPLGDRTARSSAKPSEAGSSRTFVTNEVTRKLGAKRQKHYRERRRLEEAKAKMELEEITTEINAAPGPAHCPHKSRRIL